MSHRWGLFSYKKTCLCRMRTTKAQISMGIPAVWSAPLLCPQLWRRVVHASIRSSKTVHARVLKFHIWIPHEKNSWHTLFFLSELSPFLELCPFEKIRMKSDACHILWIVHAIYEISYMDSSWKNSWPLFFSSPSYACLKKSEWNLVSMISRKVFELGAWNLVSW